MLALAMACSGADGAPGATGPQGSTGATGAQGPQGEKGDPGDPAAGGVSVVTSGVCVESRVRTDAFTITVWGAGWDASETVVFSIVTGMDESRLLGSGETNEAGAIETPMSFATNPTSTQLNDGTMIRFPGAGLYTLLAEGLSGRVASAPMMFTADKCPG